MRKYRIINNSLGWLMFLVAAVTYLLTIEPTASFWDCPEFIAQGFKDEIGHPPGNPIFILAARFAANFAGGDVTAVAKCVNAMSALFSAATILLLFWTITHLVKRLVMRDGQDESQLTLSQYLVIMGSGVAGALTYTWSDTFWFSAVEAEVYAFSSLCTALVFWLILKWEDHADEPTSDRYLILIAYVFGVSLGVHLLNLLCIPAIALIFYYRKYENPNVKGSLIALLLSFVVVALILFGLEPGFVELAGYFELFCVNTLGMSYNMGTLLYAVLLLAVLAWSIYELYVQKSNLRIKVSTLLGITLSGIPFMGSSMLIPVIIIAGLAYYLFKFCKNVPVRLLQNSMLSILVIFIGFSGYALILIRSNANTPLDENSPNSPFALASYLSRDQYGKAPLLYGQTYNATVVYQNAPDGTAKPVTKDGKMQYAREVKKNPTDPDRYVATGYQQDYVTNPELDMLFPRIYDSGHAREYEQWIGLHGQLVDATTRIDGEGNAIEHQQKIKPTVVENLQFFIDYQLNYMYWRYFMWNFAGRQNDLQGMGEITQGNWISGIPFIDNMRLGDQSLLPDDLGKGNKGHNVFFLLPLLLGIIGLLWQAYSGKRGIEQFWVVFFLFFMTGIAIVLYLNQTPSQPRERDYAYAGSFYAFAIWVGMGVAGLWRLAMYFIEKPAKGKKATSETAKNGGEGKSLAVAAVAAVIGLLVPLQMVSQTWDDHDRSGRTPARDFGMNYLSSVDKNAILFCNGDNDTFPLWYLQEVEGYRTDVRAVNLSYLSTDWYISQMQRASYESAPLPMQAGPTTYAYGERQYNYFIEPDTTVLMPAIKSLEQLYSPDYKNNLYKMPEIKYPLIFMETNVDEAIKQGVITPEQRDMAQDAIRLNLLQGGRSGLTSSQVMSIDFVASSIAQGWKRPVYFAMTIPDSYFLGLNPYMRSTGLAYQVTPLYGQSPTGDIASNTDKMYENVTKKFLWGGLDTAKPGSLYLDETIRRMVTSMRSTIMNLAADLGYEGLAGQQAKENGKTTFMGKPVDEYIKDRFDKARNVLRLLEEKMPEASCKYSITMGLRLAQTYNFIGEHANDQAFKDKAIKIVDSEIMRYAGYVRFYQSLSSANYERLNRNDLYADQSYFPQLIQYYNQINPKGISNITERLQKAGVNLERVNQYLQHGGQQPEEAEEVEEAEAE